MWEDGKVENRNIEVVKRCFKEKKIRAGITHLLNSFLSKRNVWIIHPEPSLNEQKRIWKSYIHANLLKRMLIFFLNLIIWQKIPKKIHKERLAFFRTKTF